MIEVAAFTPDDPNRAKLVVGSFFLGMGIGTFESHQYVQELGGRIDVSSQPGTGTVMRVVLPLFMSGNQANG